MGDHSMERFWSGPGEKLWLELNGVRIAMAQGYQSRAQWDEYRVDSVGEEAPAAVLRGRVSHQVELSRVAVCAGEQEPDCLYDLDGFRLAIVRPDRKIIYSGCRWKSICEQASAEGRAVLETAVLTASGRTEEKR